MGALQYVDVPGYAALLLRKTYADLALPGALMDRAHAWLAGTDAVWSEVRFRWTFPSGATSRSATCRPRRTATATPQPSSSSSGSTSSRSSRGRLPVPVQPLRRPADVGDDDAARPGPARMRARATPAAAATHGSSAGFIDRLPDPDDPDDTLEKCRRRVFIPARLVDNPHVDRELRRRARAANHGRARPAPRRRLERRPRRPVLPARRRRRRDQPRRRARAPSRPRRRAAAGG
jgi:hypothetical protein